MNTETKASLSTKVSDKASEQNCRALAMEIMNSWKHGKPVDASAAISQHPEIGQFKSVVQELALEEYCHRTDRGESLTISDFCDQFPDYREWVREQIEIGEVIPDLCLWPAPGEEFCGFEIVDKLGEGAFAHVYHAKELALGGREVAIKVSTRGGGAEAEMLGKLEHVGIVPVNSVQHESLSDRTIICMPYLGRATLDDVLKIACEGGVPKRASHILEAVHVINRNEPSPAHRDWSSHLLRRRARYADGVLQLGLQISEALAYAHQKRILHLDIKPSNILLTSDGTAKLLDFNLSSDGQGGPQPVGGTLPYMSPEQLQGYIDRNNISSAIDHRSDIYSIGLILYQLLSGRLPYESLPDSLPSKQLAQHLLECQKVPLRETSPRINDRIAKLVDSCLSNDPECRAQSADDLAKSLRHELTVLRRTTRQVKQHPIVWSFTAAVVVAVGLSAGVFLATLEPYPVRQFNAGLVAMQRGDFVAAKKHFDDAVTEDPEYVDALRARARLFGRLGMNEDALRDVRTADELVTSKTGVPDPVLAARVGYYLTKLQNYSEAIHWYDESIDRGLRSSEIYNNLAWSHHRVGNVAQAIGMLDRAINVDPQCQAAFHNRARAHFWIERKQKTRHNKSLSDIQAALSCGDITGELHRDAAQIFAARSRFESGWTTKAKSHLMLAAKNGANLEMLRADPILAILFEDGDPLSGLNPDQVVDNFDAEFLVDVRVGL
jgi:serine/threonine protein kinase